MKKNLVFIGAAFILLVVQACGVFKSKNSKDVQSTASLFDKNWKLIELNGTKVADKVNGKEPFLSFDAESRRYSASGGCNGLGGTFTIQKNEIQFSQGMSTMMACPDMSVEDGFKKIFGKTLQYEILQEGATDVLILKDGNIRIAKFSNNPSLSAEKLSGTWELDYISGPRISFEGLFPTKKPTIEFDLINSRIHGHGSCNSYNATVELDNHDIKIGAIASTKMLCPHTGEAVFFQTLEKINKFSVSDDQLTLIMGDIAMMRFKKL